MSNISKTKPMGFIICGAGANWFVITGGRLCLSITSLSFSYPEFSKLEENRGSPPNDSGKHDHIAWTVGIQSRVDKGQSCRQLCVDKRIGDGWKASGQAPSSSDLGGGGAYMRVVRLSGKPAGVQTSMSPSSNKLISCTLSCCDRNTLASAPAERGHYWSAPSAISPLTSIIILLQRTPLCALAAWLEGWLAFYPPPC